MREVMVVHDARIPSTVLKNPEEVLRRIYRNFYFSSSQSRDPGVRAVKAFVRLPRHSRKGKHSIRLLGGLVEYADFTQSIDPVRFRIRRL